MSQLMAIVQCGVCIIVYNKGGVVGFEVKAYLWF